MIKIYSIMRGKAIKLVVWLCLEFDIEIDDIKDKIQEKELKKSG